MKYWEFDIPLVNMAPDAPVVTLPSGQSSLGRNLRAHPMKSIELTRTKNGALKIGNSLPCFPTAPQVDFLRWEKCLSSNLSSKHPSEGH
jgi:hypothetical protein